MSILKNFELLENGHRKCKFCGGIIKQGFFKGGSIWELIKHENNEKCKRTKELSKLNESRLA